MHQSSLSDGALLSKAWTVDPCGPSGMLQAIAPLMRQWTAALSRAKNTTPTPQLTLPLPLRRLHLCCAQ
jgi:hypothetical protein